MPHRIGLDNIHLDKNWWWCDEYCPHHVCIEKSTCDIDTRPCSLLEHARLSINCKSGESRLVVVVECSPHKAKLPQITNRLLCLYSSWMSLPCCCDCVNGFSTKTIWHGSGHLPRLFHLTTREGSASSIAIFYKKFSISLYMDSSHRSLIAPWEDATDFGVTGMLLALITTLDFLSLACCLLCFETS